jgi:hypothetical protein
MEVSNLDVKADVDQRFAGRKAGDIDQVMLRKNLGISPPIIWVHRWLHSDLWKLSDEVRSQLAAFSAKDQSLLERAIPEIDLRKEWPLSRELLT